MHLAYVVHSTDNAEHDASFEFMNGTYHTEDAGSLGEELIKRACYSYQIFKEDNANIY